MHITLKQLQLVKAVAEKGSITNAAREVGLSQPAVSMQMKQLEEQIGENLWEKEGRRFVLTQTGWLVLKAAEDILHRLDELEGELEASRGQVVGELDIAVVTSAKHFLPHFLGEFLRQHPRVKPRLTVTNRASALEAIAANQHDLYIMGQIPTQLNVKAFPILDNIIEVVAAADHPLRNDRSIPLETIARERFLVREAGSGTRVAVDRLFVKNQLSITPFMELGSTGAIKNAVIAGLGIAVLSRHSLELELNSDKVSVLDVEGFPLRRKWYVAYPSKKRLSLAAMSFYEFLTEQYRGDLEADLADI